MQKITFDRYLSPYLIADTKNVIITSIAYDVKVGGSINFDLDLSWVCNGEELMANVFRPRQRHAVVAKVKVRTLQAVVADAVNDLLAEIAGGQVGGLSGTSASTMTMG